MISTSHLGVWSCTRMNSCPGFAALNPQHATSSLLISTRVNSLIAVFIASQPELLRSRELYGEHFKVSEKNFAYRKFSFISRTCLRSTEAPRNTKSASDYISTSPSQILQIIVLQIFFFTRSVSRCMRTNF